MKGQRGCFNSVFLRTLARGRWGEGEGERSGCNFGNTFNKHLDSLISGDRQTL